MKTFASLILSATLLVGGCSEKTAVADAKETEIQTSVQQEQSEPMVLAWEDLMPVGEEEILATMYEDFYQELENRMNAGAQRLSEMENTGEEFDLNAITEGSADDTMEQIGTFNVVSSLDGMRVRIPGYVVPLDFSADSEHKEFLLVPYFGACLHTPPPPPNQIIFVKSDPPAEVDNIYEPYWLEGTMITGKFNSDLADTAYELALTKIEPYDY